jgi:hypothetical protein
MNLGRLLSVISVGAFYTRTSLKTSLFNFPIILGVCHFVCVNSVHG